MKNFTLNLSILCALAAMLFLSSLPLMGYGMLALSTMGIAVVLFGKLQKKTGVGKAYKN